MNLFPIEKIPKDSLLQLWVEYCGIFETPYSFDVSVALSAVGAAMRRNCWFDQTDWHVYPNLPVLLVGGSGTGKDTAINRITRLLMEQNIVPIIGGRSPETITDILYRQQADPTVAVVKAGELSDFFGKKDYQSGMLQCITDLLSNNPFVDISLKSAQDRKILRPTITVMGGSTKEWLHSAMPDGSMEGGFYPRFLIVVDDVIKRQVSWVKKIVEPAELDKALTAKAGFIEGLKCICRDMRGIGEYSMPDDAFQVYDDYYTKRKGIFSPMTEAYAHRSRDLVLKISMLSAVMRFKPAMDIEDMIFATDVLRFVAERIDAALAPPTMHSKIRQDLMRLLPCTHTYLLMHLTKKYDPALVMKSLNTLLNDSREIEKRKGNNLYYPVES